MKKIAALLLVFILTFSFVSNSQADDMVKKLGRGMCNILTCPFEITQNMADVTEQDGWMAGMTYGLIKGICASVIRLSVGAYETVTFPIPVPKDYAPILTNPEFFFEN